MPPRLKEKFANDVSGKLKEQFGITNPMAAPRLEKIVLSVGMGNQLEGTKINAGAKQQVISDLTVISGQKPIMVRARKSVSNFKVREGYEVGAMVTLRGDRMWEFLDRLISTAIPRIKDFRGLKTKSFDKQGNYSFGVTEQAIFPEVNMAEAKFLHGFHITLCFKNSDQERTRAALSGLGVPFAKAS